MGGSILAVIVEISCASTFTVPLSAVTGMPTAPNAAPAVFAIILSPAALKGFSPSPISKAAQIATGAPKPIAPSKNEPKLNAIKIT